MTESPIDPTLRVRPPSMADRRAFLAATLSSRDLHHPWVSPPATDEAYGAWLARMDGGHNASFLIECDAGLVGVVNANEIVLGAFRSAYLGYYAFAGQARTGRMRAGMALVLDRVFGPELALHRVEANIQPTNERSIALVRALGFRCEGHSPDYLFIDRAWRDHDRYALLSSEWSQR